MKMTAKADSERFRSGAKQYADYLETPEGRLRTDLAFANLEDFLPRPQAEKSLGAARERLPFAWRVLACTLRCWIPRQRCWVSRSARHGKRGLRTRSYCKMA